MRQFSVESLSCPRPPHPFEITPQLCSAELDEWIRRRDEASVLKIDKHAEFLTLIFLLSPFWIFAAYRLVVPMVKMWRFFNAWFGIVGYVPAQYEVTDWGLSERRKRRATGGVELGVRVDCDSCWEPVQFPVVIDCGHCFCYVCLVDHMRKNRTDFHVSTCKGCRKIIRMIKSIEWPEGSDTFSGVPNVYQDALNVYNARFDPNVSFNERRIKYGRIFFYQAIAAISEYFFGPTDR